MRKALPLILLVVALNVAGYLAWTWYQRRRGVSLGSSVARGERATKTLGERVLSLGLVRG